MTLKDTVIEYLTLERTMEASRRVEPSARASATASAAAAAQKRRAAERLVLEGSLADAVSLGAASAAATLSAFDGVATAASDELADRARELRRLVGALGEPPALDADVKVAQIDTLRALLAAVYDLERPIAQLVLDERSLVRLRIAHWVRAGAFLVFTFIVASFAREVLFGVRASASTELSAMYGADRAVDGEADTEWIPKSNANEWLELSWPRARTIRSVKILDGRSTYDHGTRSIRVELYDHATLVHTVEGSFVAAQPPNYLILDGAAKRCDRVRLVPTGSEGHGPAIAEVLVE